MWQIVGRYFFVVFMLAALLTIFGWCKRLWKGEVEAFEEAATLIGTILAFIGMFGAVYLGVQFIKWCWYH